MTSRVLSSSLLLTVTALFCTAGLVAQDKENPIVNPAADAKFAAIPNVPGAKS